MEIVISKQREPLFHLLEAREKLKDPNLSKEDREYFTKLSKIDTVIDYGGRDSGKSFSCSLWECIAVCDYNHRILSTRYIMNSTDQSIKEAIEERLNLINYTERVTFANNTFESKENSGKIFFSGIKTSSLNQTAKLKSLEDFSIFKVDEAEELPSYKEWVKIKRSMRAKDVQCLSILSFNPPTVDHWIHEEFFENKGISAGFSGIMDNVLYIHSTYLDNYDNLAEHNKAEYDKLKEDYDLYENASAAEKESLPKKVKRNHDEYKYAILGGFRNKSEGVIYENWEYGDFNEDLPYCYGLDFGSNDPDALTKVAVDHNKKLIYVKEVYFKNNTSFEGLTNVIDTLVGKYDLIVGDSAERRIIRDLWDLGYNIKKCRRKDVKQRIKTIQGYTIIVERNSVNLAKALNNYSWHDRKSETPSHNWSDLCDSFGYAAMDLIFF